MAEFSELIKNFDKIRDYMRDFFVYGFKGREDFTQKSSRTYDNERRRIESYLGEYIKWEVSKGSKRVFISLDSSKISQNPLYAAWKSKSFTTNDIILHFYLLDILKTGEELKVEEIADKISEKSGNCFDAQTVRIKLNEYVREGIITSSKQGKALYYKLGEVSLRELVEDYDDLIDAIKYYQEAAPFGVVGSYLLDNEDKSNDLFTFKHHFIVHTLEDGVLLKVLNAMKEKREIKFTNQSNKNADVHVLYGVPLKVFVGTWGGRRYVTVYNTRGNRFMNHRLDSIKEVEMLLEYEEYDYIKEKLEENIDKCWGVSFTGGTRKEQIYLKLYIDEEKEEHIVNRLKREGKGGEILRLDKNIYLYSREAFDTNEMLSWAKTFIGRIISLECTNKAVYDKFYNDMYRMYHMYGETGGELE